MRPCFLKHIWKKHERFFTTNYHVYRTDRYQGRKGGTAIAVKKGISHDHVELPALVSVEATGVCIPVGNDVVILAAVYKSPGRHWNNTDILKLLGFKEKTISAGDLNVKHPFWNSSVSTPSGVELLELFHKNEFEILATQCPTHYSHEGNCDILNIVIHQNIRLSSVTVSNILNWDHLPILFHVLDHVKIRNFSEPIENYTDWEWFQSLASDLISPRLEINMGVEADEAAREFTASIAFWYRLSTSTVKISEVKPKLPGLDRLLRQKHRLLKLW
jgi:hypothetical protein